VFLLSLVACGHSTHRPPLHDIRRSRKRRYPAAPDIVQVRADPATASEGVPSWRAPRRQD
jgi:hypothetical protein